LAVSIVSQPVTRLLPGIRTDLHAWLKAKVGCNVDSAAFRIKHQPSVFRKTSLDCFSRPSIGSRSLFCAVRIVSSSVVDKQTALAVALLLNRSPFVLQRIHPLRYPPTRPRSRRWWLRINSRPRALCLPTRENAASFHIFNSARSAAFQAASTSCWAIRMCCSTL
jgi:hypothetical protein